MPTLDEQRDDALQRLTRHVQPDTQPALERAELEALVDRYQRASVWAAETDYNYGAKVMPVSRNGHVYVVVTAGTSGATEPTWTVGSNSTLTDSTITFREAGSDWENAYDVRAAIEAGWMQKAAKVSEIYAEGGEQMQQVFDHCIKMAAQFRSIRIA